MDRYSYLLISVFLFCIWWLIFRFKSEFRSRLFKASLFGGIAGLLAEFWYFKDYWHPPSLLGQSVILIEDVLFGFFITGVAATIYDFIFTLRFIQIEKKRKIFFGILFLIG